MNREYHRWWSRDLGRDMEMLVFGHDGLPALVFPTSCGRFYEFEDNGMVHAVEEHLRSGRLQMFCVDSIDMDSWYSRSVSPPQRVENALAFERYLLHDVLPLIRGRNRHAQIYTVGCSFGGYHAVTMALRHPRTFSGFLSMSGAFDLKGLGFLDGYYDENCYFNLPLDFLPNLTDTELLDCMRHNCYVLATGVHDKCWNDNERLASVMRTKNIPVRLDVWADSAGHDWPWWRRMMHAYV